MATDSDLGAMIDKEEGAVRSLLGKRSINRPSMGKMSEGLRVFALYSWHSEGWTPRNEALMEAVVKQARTTRHPWLVAL